MLRAFSLAVLCAILTATSVAQSKPAASPSPAGDLSPIAWMVGGTWNSDVTDLSNETVTHVASRVRWSPNHTAIQFLANFNDSPHYNGFYAYNSATKAINFYYTSSEGELTTGTATPDADGKTIRQEFDIAHTDGTTGHLKSTIVRDGDNAYWLTVFMQKNGDWAQVFRIRYERKAD